MARLQYEFRHLGLTTSAGYNPNYVVQNDVIGGDKISLSFTIDADLEAQKGITGTIAVFGSSAAYVRYWLIDHPFASVHTILVRLRDKNCNRTRGEWLIKTDSVTWCEGGICEYKLTLREYDGQMDCLKSTLIADNHRNWFPENGYINGLYDPISNTTLPAYLHPRYRYVDDIKPQALQNFVFVLAQSVLIAFNTIVGPIYAVLNIIQEIINFIDDIFGTGRVTFADDFNDRIQQTYEDIFSFFLDASFAHPSPFVRTYFTNACSKCGVQFQSSIFNDPASIYYNAAHLFGPVRKGIKISRDGDRDWVADNEPIYNAWSYAKSLRKIFNAKFRLRGGKFIFERRDFFDNTLVFNFATTDKPKLTSEICFSWSGDPKPAYQNFAYVQDSFDTDGNESLHRFNDIKDWNTAKNPLLTGEDNIIIDGYSGQRYTNDGIDQRRLIRILGNELHILDGVLLMSSDVTSVGKLIIWDPASGMAEARAIRMPVPTDYDVSTWNDDWINGHDTNDYYIYNWPFFYDPINNPLYKNLYEFHKISDPNLSSNKNIDWELTMAMCCGDVDKLLFETASDTEINAKVDYLVQLTPTLKGVINKIEILYDTATIKLSGKIK